MRFFADGPVIPNELLTYRDRGEVVFFCGAGISVPVGLPTFFQLTKRVMSNLGVASGSQIGLSMAESLAEDKPELAPPLDRVFGQLQREYSRETVEREVNALLKTPRSVDTSNHASILRLSSDSTGNPLVVTTNFDLMFERVHSKLKRWVGPFLPPLALDETPSGIVYLHGRLGGKKGSHQGLVLGSGDFGRAYLADGWATSFMRDLLERRVVVLLGYSANDPPVRYLLEGLHASSSSKLRAIYAFDRGEPAAIREKWKELGIFGIGFAEFSDLWKTLDAWAQRALDKPGWVRATIALAASSPRTLAPHERGQVAELVFTHDGAKAFASAESPPPAEWLCVFDKNVRYASVEKLQRAEGILEVDPHLEYRLDDDPPRATGRQQDGVDLLEPQQFDSSTGNYLRLANMRSALAQLDLPRLRFIANWFELVAHHPAAIWWAARQHRIHPELLGAIDRRLQLAPSAPAHFDSDTQKIWSLLHDVFASKLTELDDFDWLKVQARVQAEGWTRPVLRAFEDAARPKLVVQASFYKAPIPPASLLPSEAVGLLRFKVDTRHLSGAEIEVPDAALRPVVRALSRSLEHAVGLLEDTGVSAEFSRAPALVPDEADSRRAGPFEGLDARFVWLAELFERLCVLSEPSARAEAAAWPVDDGYFFDRLRLHFWRNRRVFEGLDVGAEVTRLSDKVFWNPYIQRELLHLLRDRWTDFALAHRRAVENRLIAGRPIRVGEPVIESKKWNAYHCGVTLGWIQRHDCTLSRNAERQLSKLRKAAQLTPELELSADHDWDGKSGWVEQRLDPGTLKVLPIRDIVAQAKESTNRNLTGFVHEYPFAGLVEQTPRRAYLALRLAQKNGEYPETLWRQLISHWPESASPRLTGVCAHRLAELPTPLVIILRHEITYWLKTHAYQIFCTTQSKFWSIWDRVFSAVVTGSADAMKSALTYSNTNRPTRRVRTYDEAANSPVGRLVQAVFATLGQKRFKKEQGFEADLRERVEVALAVHGDARYHTVALLGGRLHFIFLVDSKWVSEKLLPHFFTDDECSAALWSGVVYDSYRPYANRLFKQIKASFLHVFSRSSALLDDETERHLATMLVEATFVQARRERYITFSECRSALQSMSESGRLSALWSIGHIFAKENGWADFGKAFFAKAWPREIAYRSSSTTESLIRLATNLPGEFGDAVDTLEEYFTFVDHPDSYLFGFLQDGNKEKIVAKWPGHVLTVLAKTIRTDASYRPYQLEKVLEAIGDADSLLRSTRRWRGLRDLFSQ